MDSERTGSRERPAATGIESFSLQVALTCDDAPRMRAETAYELRAEPSGMDHFAEVLKRHGVDHCVAFTIGERADGHVEELRRWLDHGFELGNHSFDHRAASAVGAERFVDSVRRCDAVLDSLGAFEGGRQRWFRFPYLDRGSDAAARCSIAEGLQELGYRMVPASVDLFDYVYEGVLAEALEQEEPDRATAIGERYRAVALAALQRADRRTRDQFGDPAVQIPYFHFGAVSSLHLDGLLTRLRGLVQWCPVEQALEHPMYGSYLEDFECDRLATEATIPRGALERAVSRAVREISGLGLFGEPRLGPRWPHLE
jgi:peptidoglycan/xylan/chitin deacetylase (PgdA/CDA1 family)